jgi:hypothetical protein
MRTSAPLKTTQASPAYPPPFTVKPSESDPTSQSGSRWSQVLLIVLGIVGVAFLFLVIQAENSFIAISHSAPAPSKAAIEK